MGRSGIHVIADCHTKMLKSKQSVQFTFRRFFYIWILVDFFNVFDHIINPPPRVQFLRIFIGNELEFLKSMVLGTGILYRAGEERFWVLTAQSTYIAREPQWLSRHPNRDPCTQKKNKRPFSRPPNKPNKVVVVLYFQWFSRVYRTFCIWTGFLVAPSPLPSIKTCPAIIYSLSIKNPE
jgi:hypothetical protein